MVVKGGAFCRRSVPLTTILSPHKISSPGKGGGGLRGLAPWPSMRQSLMRAAARPSRVDRLFPLSSTACLATSLSHSPVPAPSALRLDRVDRFRSPRSHTHSGPSSSAACKMESSIATFLPGGCYLSDGLLLRPKARNAITPETCGNFCHYHPSLRSLCAPGPLVPKLVCPSSSRPRGAPVTP